MSDLYNRLTNLGNVQVVGDQAIPVTTAPDPVKYVNQEYRNAEAINLGLGGRFTIPAAAGPGPTQHSAATLPAPNTSLPFTTQQVTIPSSVALYLMVANAKIAAIDLIDAEPICADIFSEVSLSSRVSWPTAQTGQQIQVQIWNTDDTSSHEPRVSLTGIRLRP